MFAVLLLTLLCQISVTRSTIVEENNRVVVLWSSDWESEATQWFSNQWILLNSEQSIADMLFIKVSGGTNVSKELPADTYVTTKEQIISQINKTSQPVDCRIIFNLMKSLVRRPDYIIVLVGSAFTVAELGNIPTNSFIIMPAPRQMQTAIDIIGPAKAMLELPTLRVLESRNTSIESCTDPDSDLYCTDGLPSSCISTQHEKCYNKPGCTLLYYQCVNHLPSCRFTTESECDSQQSTCQWNQDTKTCSDRPLPPATSAPKGTWDFELVKKGADCEAAEVNLTSYMKSPSPFDCARRCAKSAGCEFFIFSQSLGHCLWVKTHSADCKEGLLTGDFDYYEMKFGFPHYESTDNTGIIVLISVICVLVVVLLLIILFRKKIALRYFNWTREHEYWDAVLLDNPFLSQLPQDRQVESSDLLHMREIGHGNFGMVYRAMFSVTKESVAVKELRYCEDAEKMFEFCNEISNLSSLPHQNIITLYGWSFNKSNEKLYMITEFCERGTLLDLTQKVMSHEERRGVAANLISIAQALAFIHDKEKAHMDVAARNILISRSGFLKLADFGLLTPVGRNVPHICYPWSPPETIETMTATTAHDVWSFGCLMYEVLAGMPPYSDRLDEINQSGEIMKMRDLVC